MGVFGGLIGSAVGKFAGGALGKHLGGGSGGEAGEKIGEAAGGLGGALLPFKTGGRIPGKKGKAIRIIAHSSEYILPIGVKPTKSQKAEVAKRKAKAKKAKK